MRASDRKRKRRTVTPVADLVGQVLAGYGVAADVREHRVVTMWHDAVGPAIAAHAWPDGLAGGVLHVRVGTSTWLHQLSFMKEHLAARVNAVVGGQPPLVREVRFHVGARRRDEAERQDEEDVVALLAGRRNRRRRAPPPRPAPTPEAVRRIEAETASIDDPELRDAIRSFRRLIGM